MSPKLTIRQRLTKLRNELVAADLEIVLRQCSHCDDIWVGTDDRFWPRDPRTVSTGGLDVMCRACKSDIGKRLRLEREASAQAAAEVEGATIRPQRVTKAERAHATLLASNPPV